jgi:ferredoxin
MKLVVERLLCQGYASCEAIAPTLFQLDAENLAVVLKAPQTPEEVEQAQDAVRACPRHAIRLDATA